MEAMKDMPRKKFNFLLKRLNKQMEREQAEIDKSSKGGGSPSGKMKYLGR